ncbi:MAG: cytochrome B [Anaerolineae bacterium]|nr:MAG: cytochrome B [Anaerolineae bacterium]
MFGSSRVPWVDYLGALAFLGALLGILIHSTLRYLSARKQARHAARLEKVYMYTAYERFWHWLQVVAIVLLLFTGLVIHRPDLFGAFRFRYMVTMHNILAAILVANAALAFFYHVASGEIRQFIPRPRGFFDQAMLQAKYYLQGIFKGEPHPFEKTPQKKLNPLQQATYFGLLNVLLPLQVLTGALMWGAQKWPQVAEALGGLPWLAPFHSLIAWLLATFIIGHVYLTTTGPTVLTDIKAMITGWEDVEIPTEETA